MKRRLIALAVAMTLAISNVPAFAAGSDAIYVSANGSDSASGTNASPVKTISKAIKLAETKKAGGDDVTIIVKEGTYRFDSTVDITSAISGTKENSTVIKAEDGAKVVFKASKELDVSKAEAVTDENVLSRLYADVRDKVVVIDLAEQGISQEDILDPSAINGNYALFGWEESWAENNAVYLNGAEQQLSRWPNNRDYATWSNGSGATFSYSDAAPSRWANAENFWVASFAEYDYIASRMAVKSINTSNKKITVIDNPVASFTSDKSKRWAAFNLLEEIDIPGEYYIDRANMKLYMYAPENFASSTLEIDVLGKAMLSIVEADNITIEGIDFAQTRSNAVFMKNVDNVDFIDCSFENIGVNGILCRGTENATTGASHWEVQQKNGSYNVDITGCDFFNIGMGAIDITGGDVDTLTKSDNVISDCFINKTAQKSYWEAISIRGCGTTVKNNNISNTPMQVIRPWGSLHTIEYNEIYDALHENDDCGMIYWGGNSVLRGTAVNYNYMHDAQAQYDLKDDKHSAIYWDDLQSGMSAQNNIFANIDGSSLFLNGAGVITHKYNTTVNSDKVLNLQNNAGRLDAKVTKADEFTTLATAKSEIANRDLYYTTFKGLEELLENGKNPLYFNEITNNFAYGTDEGTVEWSYSTYSTVENNQNVSSGDYFVNAAAQDYRIKEDAKASVNDYASLLNEENFNIESIGIQRTVSLNSETAGFDLVAPANGALYDYTDGKITLKWNAAKGANSYKVTVAKDKAFGDVVFTNETKATSQEVTGLEDTETYYWKVEAKNISRELGTTWENNGGVYTFSYAKMIEFVTPAKPENMMTTPNKGEVFGNANVSDGSIAKGFNQGSNWNNTYGAYEGYFVEATNETVANAAYYSKLAGVVTTDGAGGLAGKTLTPGKNYAVSFLARNAGNTDSLNINFGLGNVDTWASCAYSNENGEAGYTVSDKEEWTKVAGTLTAPSAKPYFSIGFPAGTPAGTKVEFNLCYKPEEAIYFAEEVLYDFKLESDKKDVNAGDTIALSAELLNQVGTAFSGDQNIEWYAMDSDKKNVVSNIAITPSADTKSATASFALDTQTGTYAIVAYSEANKVAKSILIDVEGANEKYKDYVPGAKPENMMTTPNKGEVFGNVNVQDGSITKSYNSGSNWNNTYGAYEGYFVEATKETVANAAYYSKLAGVVTTDGAGGLAGKVLTPGKNYAVSFLARNAGNTDSLNINFGLGNVDTWASCAYSNENGEAGYTVSDKEEWTKVAGTLTAPSANPYLSIGFPAGTPAGTKVEFNLCYKPEDAIYFAEEAAYDIDAKKTSGEAVVAAGSQFTAEAKILNQVGTDYTGEQTFTWYALNQGRTTEISDITITPSADTKTVTVSAGSGVQSGTYAIVAISEEYGMAKGFEISVLGTAERFKDYVPGAKPENMMNEPTSGNVFGNANSGTVEKKFSDSPWNTAYGTYNGYQIKAISETSNTGSYAKVSGITTTDKAGGLIGDTLVPGKAYVVSFLGRNNGTTDSFKVNMGLTSEAWAPTYTLEKGEEGYVISDKEEWTKIAGTIVAPSATPFLSIGFMNGEPVGASMEFNLAYIPEEAIYFAEEAAYDIELTQDKTSANILDTINLEANVLNQIGSKGALNQNFTWYVLNADRTEEVNGFTVTSSGNTAQVVPGADIATGDYTIVAVSDDYGFVKGVKVSVNGVKDIYKETAPVSKPENMMNEPTSGNVFGNANSGTIEKKFSDSPWNAAYGTYNGYQIKAVSETSNTGSYAKVSGITTTDKAGGLIGDTLVPGKAYVVSFLGRNNGTTDSFKVNMGLTSESWAPTYTLEKGEEGYVISDKEEWTKIAGTIVAPSATPFLSIGFMNGEPVGASMEFNLAYIPEEAIYFAEEIAYDIDLSGEDAVACGESASFEANVVNQVGTEGSLSQDIEWYVVNELRTAEAEGLNITAENGSATLTVEDDVALGTYYVIARSEEYDITRSFAVTVKEKEALFVDTIPGAKPENMMNEPTSGNVFGNANSGTVEKKFSDSPWNVAYGTYNGYQIKAISETSNTGSYAKVSGITTTDKAGGLIGDTLVPGKAYVVSFLGRNNGTIDSFKVNMGLTSEAWAPTYTLEKGEEGYVISDKEEWTKIAGTIVAPSATPFLSIGFMNGEPVGASMEFNLAYIPEEAIYFAEEVVYDIEVTSENPVVASNTTAEFEAKALNQVGTTGSLDQNFTWHVVSADRTEYVDGFTLSESGNKVTVSVDNTVEAGTYTIVAVSDDYELVKGIEITVTEPIYDVQDVTLSVADGVAKATVTTNVENASIFLAIYRGERFVNVDMGASGDELTLSGIKSGDVVKVFAWNMQNSPLTINPDYNTSLTVQ